MKIFDVHPVESLFISTKDLPELSKSGLFKLHIIEARYGCKTDDGQTAETLPDPCAPEVAARLTHEWVRLRCAVMDAGIAVAKCSVSVFLNDTAPQDLAYFLGFRTAEGKLYFPDPVKRVNRYDGKDFYIIQELAGKEVYALLQLKGFNQGSRGPIGNFDLIGFCDEKGRGAAECDKPDAYRNLPRKSYADFLALVPRLNGFGNGQQQAGSPYGQTGSTPVDLTAGAVSPQVVASQIQMAQPAMQAVRPQVAVPPAQLQAAAQVAKEPPLKADEIPF